MQVGETLKGCKIDSAYHEWLRIAVLKKKKVFLWLYISIYLYKYIVAFTLCTKYLPHLYYTPQIPLKCNLKCTPLLFWGKCSKNIDDYTCLLDWVEYVAGFPT